MFRVLLVVPYPKLEQTVKKIYKEYFRDTEFEVDIRVIQAEEIKHTTRIAVIVSSAQTHDETILSSILGAQVSVKTCQDFDVYPKS